MFMNAMNLVPKGGIRGITYWRKYYEISLFYSVWKTIIFVNLLEKFLDTNMVVRMAPFNFLLALNFFKQSTVSCLKDIRFSNLYFNLKGPCTRFEVEYMS